MGAETCSQFVMQQKQHTAAAACLVPKGQVASPKEKKRQSMVPSLAR